MTLWFPFWLAFRAKHESNIPVGLSVSALLSLHLISLILLEFISFLRDYRQLKSKVPVLSDSRNSRAVPAALDTFAARESSPHSA